ncbi:MAG TPA: glycosyltransferase family 4 protein [Armatimonadota bacterium]|jgi:glycosyltransferase involved in cell wall biosynthesis
MPGVLHVVSGNSLAGVERHVLLLARTQQEQGMRVHIAFPRGGWLQSQLEGLNIPYTPMSLRGTLDAISLAKLVAIVKRERLDVVHGHLIRGMFYAMATGKVARCASVGTDHMFHSNWTMRYLDRLLVPTSIGREEVIPEIRHDRIVVVPHGVDVDKLVGDAAHADEERASWGFPAGGQVVGLMGRVTNVKGHDIFLRALAAIPDSIRPWAVFAGPEEAEWGAVLRTLADELGVADRVRFLGARNNMGAVMEACDLIVAPSRMESCSLVLLEAMTLGRPVVASTVGGIPEVVEHNVTGLLVPPENPESLAEALMSTLADGALRRRLGAAAREEASERFTPQAMADATQAVYLDALNWRPVAA